MTPRTFWLILIKLIGIYFIFDSLNVVVPFITGTFYVFKGSSDYPVFQIVSGFIVVIGVYFLIFWYAIFRADSVVDKLRLETGFTETKFDINIHRSTILKIAVIVMGGLMFANVLPILCNDIFSYLRSTTANIVLRETTQSGWMIYYFVKLLVSLFMMTNSRLVVNFIEWRRKKSPAVNAQSLD